MTRGQRRRLDGGQSTVELALCLPVLLMALLMVVQVGLVVRDQIRTVHAAREAARSAAVDADGAAATSAALAGSGLAANRTSVSMSGRGDAGSRVTVTVTYQAVTDVPLVGALIPDPTMRAEATMRVEG